MHTFKLRKCVHLYKQTLKCYERIRAVKKKHVLYVYNHTVGAAPPNQSCILSIRAAMLLPSNRAVMYTEE